VETAKFEPQLKLKPLLNFFNFSLRKYNRSYVVSENCYWFIMFLF